MVQLHGVGFSYFHQQELPVLKNLSLELITNRSYALLGQSGCGKTTLLYLLAQILTPNQGRLEWDYSGSGVKPVIGFVTQTSSLFPWKTALDNVVLGLSFRNDLSAFEKKERSMQILDTLGLAQFCHRYPRQLSGGQTQRVSLARTLVAEPQFLLMDEPTSQLDEMTREEVQETIRKVQCSQPRTLVFVTHSVEEAVYLGEYILVMDQGAITSIIDNDSFGLENARLHQKFYHVCRNLRDVLQPASQSSSHMGSVKVPKGDF
jgi:NitT/TauT family transport system ATP-binding protein